MLLLTGPPGSDRTSRILTEFRQALGRNGSGIRLLTPTATMAEHLGHRLAREGFVLRPNAILTLSKFVAPWVEDLPEISAPAFYLLVERVAREIAPAEFARVLHTPGFCAALAQTVEEISSAGCNAARLEGALPPTAFGPALVTVAREVEREMARRGVGLRSVRLARAAQRIAQQGLAGVNTVWMDGFLALTDPELAVVRAIGAHADLTVTLPVMDGPAATRDGLLAMGFREQSLEIERPEPAVQGFAAATIDREADEIARRILSSGNPFGETGIIVRNPDVYVPTLRAELERFGIPARFYFSDPLAPHRVDGPGNEKAILGRSKAGARPALAAAVEEAAKPEEDAGGTSLDGFWTAAAAVVRLSPLRVRDHRRNVVHVLSVFEARQW